LSDKPCVEIITGIEGQLLKSVSNDNTGNAHFMYPGYICVTTENNAPIIYVSDPGTRTITRLSEQLEVLHTFFKVPTENGPYGMASAGGGQLLVRGLRPTAPSLPTLMLLDTGTGEFTEKQRGIIKMTVWFVGFVAFCPRLGRVYVNAGNRAGNECITVYEISNCFSET